MASGPPSKAVVNFIKTSKSVTCLRKQYSVEVIDPQHLAALGCVDVPKSADACLGPMRTGGKIQQEMIEPPRFTLFPILPIELRLEIWKMAAFPRIVIQNVHNKDRTGGVSHGRLYTPCSPVLMRASREARQVALETYDLFGADTAVHVQDGPIYFNFELDILAGMILDGKYFSETSIFCFPTIVTKRVRHMAICDWQLEDILGSEELNDYYGSTADMTGVMAAYADYAYRSLRGFEKLETILVMNMNDKMRPLEYRPWKINILKGTDLVVQQGRDNRYYRISEQFPLWRGGATGGRIRSP